MICKPKWSGEAKPGSKDMSRGGRSRLGNLTRFENATQLLPHTPLPPQ